MVSPESQGHVERRAPVAEEGPRERRRARKREGGGIFGTSAEVIVGAGAAVLAVLGLIGLLPQLMAAIAAIAIGAGILFEGAAVASRMRAARGETDGVQARRAAGGGITAEMLAGASGIVLGILALVGILPLVLLPIAALVYGATLLLIGLSRPAMIQVTRPNVPQRRAEDRAQALSEAAAASSSGALGLAGAAAAVLGILVLADVAPAITTVLIATLVVGAALLVSGSSLAMGLGRTVRA